jgi:formyl-CoA transferase
MGFQWSIEGRNKRSITANLTTPEGCEVVRQLAAQADVLVENAVPGVMAKRGLGYEDLRAVNPRLVYVSVTGYGHGNEMSSLPGYDYTGSAFGGLTATTGFRDRPPVLPGLPVVDFSAGAFGAIGALQAVYRRDRAGGTGLGEWIDVALYEAMLRYSSPLIPAYAMEGWQRRREGSMPIPGEKDPGNYWGYVYETSDHSFVALSPPQRSDKSHQFLMRLVERPDLATDERMSTYSGRVEHVLLMDEVIRAWSAKHTVEEFMDGLRSADIPSSPVNSMPQILQDPVVKQRNLITANDGFGGPEIPMQGPMPRMKERPGRVDWAGEPLGASNEDVYCGLLGWTPEQLAAAQASGLV